VLKKEDIQLLPGTWLFLPCWWTL